MITPISGPVVVGVRAPLSEDVVRVAASFAAHLSARLVCVVVDPSRFVAGRRPDGSAVLESVDPDVDVADPEALRGDLEARIASVATRAGVDVELRIEAGDPTRAIAWVAETLGASMIVVGTHRGRGRASEFFSGSIAAQLSHRQHRPVLVVPTDPVGFDEELPWSS